MAGFAGREVEILVHTTAPSRGQDDARYRALARAYLDFEPAEIHRLEDEPDTESEEDVDIQAGSQLQEELEYSILGERESQASYQTDDGLDSQSASQFSASARRQNLGVGASHALASPALSFNSAFDNADSPVWRGLERGFQKVQEAVSKAARQHKTQKCQNGESIEIADSQPENNKTIPAFSSPTRILELYLQQIQSSGERSFSSYDINKTQKQTVDPSLDLPDIIQQSQSPILGSAKTSTSSISVVPSSPSPEKRSRKTWHSRSIVKHRSDVTPSTQDPAMLAKRKWLDSSPDDSHISSSAPTRLSIESSIVTTRSRKRQCIDGSVDEITETKEATASKVTMVATSSAPSFEVRSIWAGKLEIRPPPPRTSIGNLMPDMLVTSHLQCLAQKMPLGVLFRPKQQTRDLRAMERGHWIVKCETWDPGVWARCWECLGNFIGKGMAGWGVWATRDAELPIIKLYCWGNIVGHAYLLLFMVSESKIKGTRACWIGGDGEAIIEMPG